MGRRIADHHRQSADKFPLFHTELQKALDAKSRAPYLALLTVQKVWQHMIVGHRSCRGAHQVNDAFLGIHSHVRLRPEIALGSFTRLVHFRVTFPVGVLGRRWCMSDGDIHNRASPDAIPRLSKFRFTRSRIAPQRSRRSNR
jgi:hypothetical protein